MNKIRHLLPLLLIPLLLFSCRQEKSYRIGVSQCSDDDWRRLMNEQILREVMFHPEATVEIRSGEDNNEKQIEDIRYFADNGFDIIIAAPNEADALTPVIKEVYDRGIPILIFDRCIHGNTFTAFQGADNAGIGERAAIYAAGLLPQGGRIIELGGLPGSTPAEERSEGFHKALDSIGRGLKVIASVPANWRKREADPIADSLLRIYPDVDLIYAHNDRMAIGAADAAARLGLDPYIIGIDAAPEIGMKAVAEGKIDATFLYPTEGQQIVKTALAILEGEPYERVHIIPASPAVDKENVELLLHQNALASKETEHMKELKNEVDLYWTQHTSQTTLLYAAIIILVLLCIVLFLVLRTFWQHRRHQEQLAAATQSKLNFFTNVSHDLRTPLTLIAEPVAQMAEAPNIDIHQRRLMHIANKNVKILKRLINQILDFRKFEHDKLFLCQEECAPALLAREWAEAFQPLALKKHIDFAVNINVAEDFTMAMDVEKVERVVFNLLANAFKFTPVKGRIEFNLSLKDNHLFLNVSDTGRGISEESMKNIFVRFYQVDRVRPEGSGIGLSLAKAFVELHGGSIRVESREGEGASFTVALPIKHVEARLAPESLEASRDAARSVAGLIEDTEDVLPSDTGEVQEGKPLVLVIDDNDDIRILVKELLRHDYNIIGAPDGREGIRLASKHVPDLIICDVMMPGLDGMQTCAAIKGETATSHIPVLMLTACAMDEQRAEGYESGADGYMSKPFNKEVLRARIASLIANRRRIKEILGSDNNTFNINEKASESRPRDAENEFYSRFISLVNAEMGNADLSVDSLAEKLGIGRSQFYRKIKALTNLSPVELLRDMRLKKARELLLSTDKTISEIAYEVGFSNPAYFTKCYREVYSETPSALRAKIAGNGA